MRSFGFHIAVAGFALGIALYFIATPPWVYGAGSALLGVSLLAVWWRNRAPFEYRSQPYLAILFIVLGLGLLRAWHADTQLAHDTLSAHVGTTLAVEGIVILDPETTTSGVRFVIETSTDERVFVYGPTYPVVAYGDLVRAEAPLELPEAFETDSGRLFNYPRFLAKDGIRYIMRRAQITIVERGAGKPVMRFFVNAKHAFVRGIERAVSEPSSGLAAGVVLGVEGSLSARDEEAFRIASLIHIVVVSGYNITLAGNFAAALLSSFPPLVASAGSVVGILSYTLLTGASSTAIRASIMACIMVLARITKRRYDVVRALLAAAFFMALHTPHIVLYDPSFQLSFLATWGLVKITPLFERWLSWITERGGLREVITTTLGAQTAVTPLLLYQSGSTHLLSLVANIVVLPFMPAFMMTSIATGIAGLVHPYLALPFALPVELIGAHVFWIVDLMGMASAAVVSVGQMPVWVLVGVYVGLVVGVEWFSQNGREVEKA
jgi:competence protein ComEC